MLDLFIDILFIAVYICRRACLFINMLCLYLCIIYVIDMLRLWIFLVDIYRRFRHRYGSLRSIYIHFSL